MIRYTTPTISLTVEKADLTGKDVYVSLEQGSMILTKSGSDLTVTVTTVDEQPMTTISFTMTQEESATFNENKSVSVQVNFISADGVRAATGIKTIKVMRNLLNEVIEYGD